MSSNLFPYKFSNGEWFSADDINESDVAVIIDTSREAIWFYTGSKSTARNRSNARELLSDLLNQYSTYVMNIVADDAPDDILVKLEDLKEQYYRRKFARIEYDLRKVSQAFFYLNLIACLFLVISITVSIFLIVGGYTTLFESYFHFKIPTRNFNFLSILLLSLMLSSFIIFTTNTLIGLFINKRILFFSGMVSSVSSFLSFFILYIWDLIIYYQIIGSIIYIRTDVFFMFITIISIFGSISLLIGGYMLIISRKEIMKPY
jgi:hypothetical protein